MKNLDLLDVFIMVILCLVVVPIGYRVVVRQQTMYRLEKAVVEDKNVRSRERITDNISSAGGEYDTWELLLSTQIQDYYMPQPKALSVMGLDNGKESYLLPLDISATFEAERDIYVDQFQNQLRRIDGLTREVTITKEDGTTATETLPRLFTLEFSPGANINSTNDDYFYFKKLED